MHSNRHIAHNQLVDVTQLFFLAGCLLRQKLRDRDWFVEMPKPVEGRVEIMTKRFGYETAPQIGGEEASALPCSFQVMGKF